jgi:hypothetical protein
MSTGSRDGSNNEDKNDNNAGVNSYSNDNYKYNYGDDYDDESSAYGGKSTTKEVDIIEIFSNSSNTSSSSNVRLQQTWQEH